MKKLIVSLILSLFCITGFTQEFSQPLQNIDHFRQRVQESSGSLESIRSKFRQEKHLAVLNEPAVSSGDFYYRDGGFVRWDYSSPAQQSIILKQDEVIIINEGKRQKVNARTARAYQQMNGVIAEVIHGDAFANKDFEYAFYVYEKGSGGVIMRPKSAAISAHLESIKLFFDADFRVERLELHEPSGDFTRYIFFDQRYNVDIPAAVFEPEPLK